MENEELRKLLQQLHDEIEKTQTVDEKGTEILSDLDGDIRALLERSEEQLTPTELLTDLDGDIHALLERSEDISPHTAFHHSTPRRRSSAFRSHPPQPDRHDLQTAGYPEQCRHLN